MAKATPVAADTASVRLKTDLFKNCRMSGVLIPGAGEVVELSTADALALCEYDEGTHAEVAADAPAEEPAPAPADAPAPAPAPADSK